MSIQKELKEELNNVLYQAQKKIYNEELENTLKSLEDIKNQVSSTKSNPNDNFVEYENNKKELVDAKTTIESLQNKEGITPEEQEKLSIAISNKERLENWLLEDENKKKNDELTKLQILNNQEEIQKNYIQITKVLNDFDKQKELIISLNINKTLEDITNLEAKYNTEEFNDEEYDKLKNNYYEEINFIDQMIFEANNKINDYNTELDNLKQELEKHKNNSKQKKYNNTSREINVWNEVINILNSYKIDHTFINKEAVVENQEPQIEEEIPEVIIDEVDDTTNKFMTILHPDFDNFNEFEYPKKRLYLNDYWFIKDNKDLITTQFNQLKELNPNTSDIFIINSIIASKLVLDQNIKLTNTNKFKEEIEKIIKNLIEKTEDKSYVDSLLNEINNYKNNHMSILDRLVINLNNSEIDKSKDNVAIILRSIQNNQTSLDDAIKQINNLQQENINKLTELFNKNEYIMDIIEDPKKSNELTKIGLSNISSLKDLNNLTKKELDELLKLDMKDYETLQILLIINNIYKKTIKSINPK